MLAKGDLVSIDVIIPSVGRPVELGLAVESVLAARESESEELPVGEVLVVYREFDLRTKRVAESLGAKLVPVSRGGLAHAMRAGAIASTADVVAFMDDDARMRPGWFGQVAAHYTDRQVVGVGGRDLQPRGYPVRIRQSEVGMIDCFGRVFGGHHLAVGPARPVEHLKGVNCSFRRTLFCRLPFQEVVFGQGAQARNEFVASLVVGELGGQLILEPSAVVDHFPAERQDGDERGDKKKAFEAAFNESLGFHLTAHPRAWRNTIFLIMLGYRYTPGVARILQRGTSLGAILATIRGAIKGAYAGRKGRRRGLEEGGVGR